MVTVIDEIFAEFVSFVERNGWKLLFCGILLYFVYHRGVIPALNKISEVAVDKKRIEVLDSHKTEIRKFQQNKLA
jgi:hypothetical protein